MKIDNFIGSMADKKPLISFEFTMNKPSARAPPAGQSAKSNKPFTGFSFTSVRDSPQLAVQPISIFQDALNEKDDEAELEQARRLSANVRTGASKLKQVCYIFSPIVTIKIRIRKRL